MAVKKGGAKPKPKGGAKGKKKGGFSCLLVILLALAVVSLGGWLAYEYNKGVVRDKAEEILGQLDSQGMVYEMGNPSQAEKMLSDLKKLSKSSYGALSLEKVKRPKGKMKFTLVLGKERFPVELRWPVHAERPKPKPRPVQKPIIAKSQADTYEPDKPPATFIPPEKPKVEHREKPRLAIVIDDFGADAAVAEDFVNLPFSITPAVLPYLKDSEAIARDFSSQGRPYLLHLPMEPQNAKEKLPGEGALMTSYDEGETKRLIDLALKAVPGAQGVNNHMGSRATEDAKLMDWVMEELSDRGLYFLDSKTSAKSVAGRQAMKAGLSYAERNIFLDNTQDVGAIKAKLAESVRLAKEQGSAIAIGHPHKETLQALMEYADKFEAEGITLVPLEDILVKPNI